MTCEITRITQRLINVYNFSISYGKDSAYYLHNCNQCIILYYEINIPLTLLASSALASCYVRYTKRAFPITAAAAAAHAAAKSKAESALFSKNIIASIFFS